MVTQRALVLACVAMAICGLACVNPSPSRLYATLSWKVRCPTSEDIANRCMGGCVEGVERMYDGFDGEGARLSCSVLNGPVLNFQIILASGEFLALEQVVISGGVGVDGRVRVREGNEYEGRVGAGAPSDDRPCQVTDVQFTRDMASGDSLIIGKVRCYRMRSPADRLLCRGLSAPGGQPATAPPFEFRIYACPGAKPGI
ncbi:MAG: hypothetical protein RMJ84_01220 [Sandaracinaceae bacterium]|nr:hypothetical protein [Sandaracinaceae bacterium]